MCGIIQAYISILVANSAQNDRLYTSNMRATTKSRLDDERSITAEHAVIDDECCLSLSAQHHACACLEACYYSCSSSMNSCIMSPWYCSHSLPGIKYMQYS